MIYFAKRKKKASHIDYKAITQHRHCSAAETLDQLWNGQNWLPPWPKHTSDTLVSYNQLSSPELSYILATSKLASANGVDLLSLYQANGVFYQAAASIKFPLQVRPHSLSPEDARMKPMSDKNAFSDLGLFPAPSLSPEPSLRHMVDDNSGRISIRSSPLAQPLMSCDVRAEFSISLAMPGFEMIPLRCWHS
ncbi:hypothetical protein ACHAPA_010485 [Fusarium lateritium]